MPQLIGQSEGRVGSARVRTRGGRPVYEESYTFIVEAESIHVTRDDILFSTSGLPQINLTTSAGGFARCVALGAVRRQDKPLIWDVTADFSSEVEEGSGSPGTGTPNDNPNVWVPIYETKFERYQKVVTKDASGNPYVNSAGQPFENALIRTRHIPVWEFYQFESATVTDETVIARNETVNVGEFKGRAAKTLLCIVMSSVIGSYYGLRRRLTQYQLKYDKDTWQIEQLDVGTRHMNAAGTATVPYNAKILDSGGYTNDNLEVILGPLDGSGDPAGGFDGATDFAVMDGTEPAILTFDQYPTIDFNTFLRI